jgi:hypothetical protein
MSQALKKTECADPNEFNAVLAQLGSVFSVSDLVQKVWVQLKPVRLMIVDGETINLKPTEDQILHKIQEIADTKPGNGVRFFEDNQIAEISWFTNCEEDEYKVIIYGLTQPIQDLINEVLEVE